MALTGIILFTNLGEKECPNSSGGESNSVALIAAFIISTFVVGFKTNLINKLYYLRANKRRLGKKLRKETDAGKTQVEREVNRWLSIDLMGGGGGSNSQVKPNG